MIKVKLAPDDCSKNKKKKKKKNILNQNNSSKNEKVPHCGKDSVNSNSMNIASVSTKKSITEGSEKHVSNVSVEDVPVLKTGKKRKRGIKKKAHKKSISCNETCPVVNNA